MQPAIEHGWMQTKIARCYGLDVHKKQATAWTGDSAAPSSRWAETLRRIAEASA